MRIESFNGLTAAYNLMLWNIHWISKSISISVGDVSESSFSSRAGSVILELLLLQGDSYLSWGSTNRVQQHTIQGERAMSPLEACIWMTVSMQVQVSQRIPRESRLMRPELVMDSASRTLHLCACLL